MIPVCLFTQALQTSSAGSSLAARLEVLSNAITQLVMDHVSQALFNADRLPLGMHMARSLAPQLFQPQDWSIFLGKANGRAQVKSAMCIWRSLAVTNKRSDFDLTALQTV